MDIRGNSMWEDDRDFDILEELEQQGLEDDLGYDSLFGDRGAEPDDDQDEFEDDLYEEEEE
jgi:hypothetical protein